MNRRLPTTVQSGVLLCAALVSACSREEFPVVPTPVASSAVVLQGSSYQGTVTLASGATTSFNMTLIARSLAGATRVVAVAQTAGTFSLTGNFETGHGLTGTVQGTVTGSLDDGFFNGSLIANPGGQEEERQYSGPVTAANVAWVPGDCVRGCPPNELTFSVHASTPTAPPCAFSISPTSVSFPATGGTGSTTVTAGSNCAWTAESLAPWISVVGAATGTAAGTVTFTVQANPGGPRESSLRIAGQSLAVVQADGSVPACTYGLTPASATIPAAGGSFSAALALSTSCSGAWTASSDASWIGITSAASGTTGGTISYMVSLNSGASRTGRISVTGPGGSALLAVTQAGACGFTLTPSTQSVPAAGGAFSTVLAIAGSCSGTWTASSDVSWITGISPASGTTGGTIAFSVGSNPGTQRTGYVTVTGPGDSTQLTVTQAGPCGFTLTPSTQSVPTAGGAFSTVLGIAGTCSGTWTASSDVAWITGISPASGTTGGTIAYSVASNPGTQRTGHLTVTGPGVSTQLTVTQGATCTYAMTPAAQSVAAAGGPFSTVLAITGGCSGTWTAASDVTWITGISPASGTAGGTIAYSVASNPGVQRTGHLTVTGPGISIQLTVTQSATCTFTLNPNTQSAPAAGGVFQAVLTTTASCVGTWTASSNASWITGISPASGTAGATITYVVQSNFGPTRGGAITVTGSGGTTSLIVTQAAGISH